MTPFSDDSEQLFRSVVEAMPNGIVVVERSGDIVLVNQEAERLFGYRRDELIGQPVEVLLPAWLREAHRGERERFARQPETRPMGRGRDLHGRRKNAEEFPVEIGLNTIRRTDGGFWVLASIVDISARKAAERRIAEQQERLRLVVESSPNGVLTVDAEGRIALVNAQIEKLFGYERDELIGQPVEVLVPVRLREAHRDYRQAFAASPVTRPMGAGRELFGRRKDATEFPVEIGLNAIQSTGHGDAVLATIVDITDRVEAERRQGLLVREIFHRTKNLLSVVQSIANRSLSGDRTLPEAREAFLDRLFALSRTDSMLVEHSLEGVDLGAIIRQELESYSERVDVQGCDLFLKPSAAQDFALLVHELATNAAKYGALSRPNGHVTVGCVIEHDSRILRFHWRESGGPPVSPPAQRGFGLTLMERISKGLGESSELEFESDGLRYELRTPLAFVVPSVDSVTSSHVRR